MIRRSRHFHPETPHNQDRWLLTYADMITLLTAFFLMLYSMSVMSKGKFSQLAVSIRSGFSGSNSGGGKLIPNSTFSINQLGLSAREYPNYSQAMRNLRRYVEQTTQAGAVTTRTDERGVVISLVSDNMLFDRGKAEIRPATAPLLSHIAEILRATGNRIAIEGHTCDLPIHTPQFPSNWELSTARAGSLLRYFTGEQGLQPQRFMAAGYADTHPLVSNTSEANRARNRRVEIVIMKTEARRDFDLAMRAEARRITVNAASDIETDPGSTDAAPGVHPDNPSANPKGAEIDDTTGTLSGGSQTAGVP